MSHRLLLAESPYYPDISAALREGAVAEIEKRGALWDFVEVSGALEIPILIRRLHDRDKNRYDAFVALGCVIRGETSHYEIVSQESARGLMDLSIRYGLVIGNGILTCDRKDQAAARADPKGGDKGGWAARAALEMLDAVSRIREGSP